MCPSNEHIGVDLSVFHEMDKSDERKARNLSLSETTWSKVKLHTTESRGRAGQASRLITLAVFLLHALLSKRPTENARGNAYNLGWTIVDIVPNAEDRLELMENILQFGEGIADRIVSIVREKDR